MVHLPHRRLGYGHLPPHAALYLDRTVLAAARKHRAHGAALDAAADPGPYGVVAVLRALQRLYVRG
jgi:hypothetical protein